MTNGKDCKKGYSCKMSCINRSKDCLVEFPPKLQKILDSVSDEKLKRGLEILGPFISENEKGDLVFLSTEEGQERILPFEEIQKIKEQGDLLEKADTPEGRSAFVEKARNLRGRDSEEFTPEEVESLFKILPASLRKQLSSNGSAGKVWYNGEGEPPSKSPKAVRGVAVLSLYLNQGGRDAYSAADTVWGMGDLSVEHIIPLSKGGIDSPENWVLTRRGSNQERGDIPYSKWIKSLPNTEEEWEAYKQEKIENRERYQQLKEKASEKINIEDLSPEQILTMGSPRPLAMAFSVMRFENPDKPVPKGSRTMTTTPAALVKLMMAEGATKDQAWLNSFYSGLYSLKSSEGVKEYMLSEFKPFPDTELFNKAVDNAVKILTKEYQKFND